MAILDESELSLYAPGANADEASIFLAQSAIEAWLGFPIEQAERIELLRLSDKTKTAQLSYNPIASSPAPVIEVRQGNDIDRLDRPSVVTDWLTLQAGDYVLDSTGLISLNILSSAITFNFSLNNATDLRATYTAGIDFSADTAEVKSLKSAAGRIVLYQSSEFAKTGIIEIDIPNQSRQRWGSGSTAANQGPQTLGVPNSFFTAFQKFKPRSMILAG